MSNYEQTERYFNAKEFLEFIEVESKKPGNENTRYELINGQIYMMASPNIIHHDLSEFIEDKLKDYFLDKGCRVFRAPVDLYLFDKKHFALFGLAKTEIGNVLIPDLMVVCDKTKIKRDGVHGAPDFIVEVVSESNAINDYVRKLNAYLMFGVSEYWIADPIKKKVIVYSNTSNDKFVFRDYALTNIVNSEIFNDLSIDFNQFVWPEFEEDN